MKKYFRKLILIFIFSIFLVACSSNCEQCTSFPTLLPTLHPDAVAPMTEISRWNATCAAAQATVQVLGKTATVASFTMTPVDTLTPSPTWTPTITPTPRPKPITDDIKILLNNELCQAFGIERNITSITFAPETGSNAYENVVVYMECKGEKSDFCKSKEAFIDFVNVCKDNQRNISDIFPNYTKTIQLWVFQPDIGKDAQVIFDINWVNIQNYLDNKMTVDEFKVAVFSFTPPTPEP